MQSQNFLNQLNALVNCDPENCTKASCTLYYEEAGKCDANRYISLFSTTMHQKLENVKKYDTFSEEDTV